MQCFEAFVTTGIFEIFSHCKPLIKKNTVDSGRGRKKSLEVRIKTQT